MQLAALLTIFSTLALAPQDPPAPPSTPAPVAASDERLEHALTLLARLDEKITIDATDAPTVGTVPVWLRLKGFPIHVDAARLVPRSDTTAFEESVPAGETTYGALLNSFARAAGSEFDPWSIDSDGFSLVLLPDSGRDRLALSAIYQVVALARNRASSHASSTAEAEVAAIVELLHEQVVPDGWTEMGGNLVSMRTDGMHLVVTGAPAVHRSIREMLRQLEIAAGMQSTLVFMEVFECPANTLKESALTSAQLDVWMKDGTVKLLSAPKFFCAEPNDAQLGMESGHSKLTLSIHPEPESQGMLWTCEASLTQPDFNGKFVLPFRTGAPATCASMVNASGELCIVIRLRSESRPTPKPVEQSEEPAKTRP